MPTVNKQKVTPPTRDITAKPGSLLSLAKPVNELENQWIKLCTYGENRVGKTTLACQFEKPLILIAMEPNQTGGAVSVRKIPGIDYIRITSSKDGNQLARELRGSHYKTAVIDSATSYQDIILTEIMGLEQAPEMLAWGIVSMDQYRERSEKTRECLRPFLNLEMNVIVTAKQRDHNRQDKSKPKILGGLELESYFAADLGGATTGWLHDACDYICRLYIEKETKEVETKMTIGGKEKVSKSVQETGKLVRRLQTMYHPNFAGGFRSDTPNMVPEFIQDPNYAKIMKVIRGEKL